MKNKNIKKYTNNNKYEIYIDKVFAPWALRVVIGSHIVVLMIILQTLAFQN